MQIKIERRQKSEIVHLQVGDPKKAFLNLGGLGKLTHPRLSDYRNPVFVLDSDTLDGLRIKLVLDGNGKVMKLIGQSSDRSVNESMRECPVTDRKNHRRVETEGIEIDNRKCNMK